MKSLQMHLKPTVRCGFFRQLWGRPFALASCLGLAALMTGCSKEEGRVPVYPVKGTVAVLGEIPEGALIILYPTQAGGEKELRPSAKVGKDGAFTLTTYEADDGAPAGEYTGTIQWNKLVKKGADFVAGPNAVPQEYGSRETSPWKVKVTEGSNKLEPIDIKKK